MLVKWSIKTKPQGTLFIDRDIFEGPRKSKDYFDYLNNLVDMNDCNRN
jgi:hypothetical protein